MSGTFWVGAIARHGFRLSLLVAVFPRKAPWLLAHGVVQASQRGQVGVGGREEALGCDRVRAASLSTMSVGVALPLR